MKCEKPYFDKKNGRQFNCGKCHACRVNETSKWTVRCLYELDKWKNIGASFITLTYDDEHLPKNLGLQPEHLQKFFKRLRINLIREFGTHFDEEKQKEVPNVPIVYKACGEYGETEKKYIGNNGVALGRPHYHAIIFGLDDINDRHRDILIKSWPFCDPYMFDKTRKDNGMLPVCREDIAYVCGYTQKKLNGVLADEVYGDRHPPFPLTSQGLGLDFAMKNKNQLSKLGYITLHGQKIGLPKYFRDKLGIVQSDLINLNKTRLLETQDLVFQAFNEHLNKLGLLWLLDDPIKNSDSIERRYYAWHEIWENENFNLIESEYQKGRLIRGKGKL